MKYEPYPGYANPYPVKRVIIRTDGLTQAQRENFWEGRSNPRLEGNALSVTEGDPAIAKILSMHPEAEQTVDWYPNPPPEVKKQ